MRRRGQQARALRVASVVAIGRASGAAPVPDTLRIRFPSIFPLNDENAAYQALSHTADGCYCPIICTDGNYYPWFTLNNFGTDPGPREGLTGWTGVRINLSFTGNDRETVNTAAAAALEGIFDAVTLDEDGDGFFIDVTHSTLDAAASVAHYATQNGYRELGGGNLRGWRGPNAGSGAAATTQRAMRYDVDRIPRRGTIIGLWAHVTAHTAGNQLHLGISQGADGSPAGSGAVTSLGVTVGSSTGRLSFFLPYTGRLQYELDEGETLFLNYKTDASISIGFNASGTGSPNGVPENSDFADALGNNATAGGEAGIWIVTGAPSGSGTSFISWGTVGSSVEFYSALALMIQTDQDADGSSANTVGYYNNFMWEAPFGVTQPQSLLATNFTGVAEAEVRVAWPWTMPAGTDMELASLGMGYGTKSDAVSNDRFRLTAGVGGASDTDWTGATTVYSAQTPGGVESDVWSDIEIPAAEHYPIPASSRLWLLVHRAGSGGANSTIRFNSSTSQTNRYRGLYGSALTFDGTNETEDATALDAGTPMTDPWAPVGSLIYPTNAGAVRGRIRVRRTTLLEANPS